MFRKTPRTAMNDKSKVLYSISDCPPFIIHVYSLNDDASSGLVHPLLISRTLSQLAYFDIKEIKRIGRGKILAEMKSAKAANNLVQDPRLEKENLRAFITTYRTVKLGPPLYEISLNISTNLICFNILILLTKL